MIRFSLPWSHSITLFLYLICLCSRSDGHFPSHFNGDKARPYVGALSVLITFGICHFFCHIYNTNAQPKGWSHPENANHGRDSYAAPLAKRAFSLPLVVICNSAIWKAWKYGLFHVWNICVKISCKYEINNLSIFATTCCNRFINY